MPTPSDSELFIPAAQFSLQPLDGRPGTVVGYGIVWDALSNDRGGYRVRIPKGAATFFDPTVALFQHDQKSVIGTTANKSLRIEEDDKGTKFSIDLPDTTAGRDVAELVKGGYLPGLSIGMTRPPRGRTAVEAGQKVMTADPFKVHEVSVVVRPAFPDAVIAGMHADDPARLAARRTEARRFERYRLDTFRPAGAGSPRSAT